VPPVPDPELPTKLTPASPDLPGLPTPERPGPRSAILSLTAAPLAPKIATLATLAAAGLPVPAGLALPDPGEPTPAAWQRIDSLLQAGPVIVRAALLGEDGPDHAAAGLGTSVPGCHDRESVRAALHRIADALHDPWLTAYFPAPPQAQVLVQHEISGPWLAVVAQTQLRHLELHHLRPISGPTPADLDPSLPDPTDRDTPLPEEPLAAGHTPTLAGPLALFPDPLRSAIDHLCDRVTALLPSTPHGLDLELVADPTTTIWIVQARPLTRPLDPGWPAFVAAVLGPHAAPATRLPLPGLWRLDAEHNPAPLSPGHAGAIARLARTHPTLVRARVLAGWLYTPASLTPKPTTAPTLLRRALDDLQHIHIPEARAALTDLERQLLITDFRDHPETAATLVDHACDLLRDVLARYATLPPRPASLAPATDRPHSLAHRDHLDILPATWDIASPTLLDLSPGTALARAHDLSQETSSPPPAPDAPDALATLLGELDDHLFALGLAPLRRVYLHAAAALALAPADIFLLSPDELQAALRGASFDLVARRREHDLQTTLFPPLQLFDGLPVPGHNNTVLQGIAIGPVTEGPLAQRRDLADLLADPPAPGAVLAIPALTAQAAVVLRALGVQAVCCEHGGAMSHAALMARELGLTALIGCRGCTTLPGGTWVRLDTRTGRLRVRPT